MDKREEIPLLMFPGNMDILLEHRIEVEAISFCESPRGVGVILMFHFSPEQRVAAHALGFTTGKPEELNQ